MNWNANRISAGCFAVLVCLIFAGISIADPQLDPRSRDSDSLRPADNPQPGSDPTTTPESVPKIEDLRNHPNPFNSSTNISFNLPSASETELRIYDILGREVDRIDLGVLDGGSQSIKWDSSADDGIELPTGIYFYRVIAGNSRGTGKMLLIK
jgi:hypothetical protein